MQKSGSQHETNKTCREIRNSVEFQITNKKTKSHSSTSHTKVGLRTPMAKEMKPVSQFLWLDKRLPPNSGLKRQPFYCTICGQGPAERFFWPHGVAGGWQTGRCGATAAASFTCWAPEQEWLQLASGARVPAGLRQPRRPHRPHSHSLTR